ncbi:MAG: hypothetical protein JW738_01960 [Actinobacteria bacterium]|nr:hypothetical protein [Actinomycetota bacterium]
MNETLRIVKELVKYRLVKRKESHLGKVINLFGNKHDESVDHGGSDAPKRTAGCN